MQAWEIISGDGVDALNLNEREIPILLKYQYK